jgi:hypothetical protein
MGLLAWQWNGYPNAHRNRGNLLLHLLTWPWFVAGVVALTLVPLHRDWRIAVAGLGAMMIAMVLQGRGHRREEQAPEAFRGPLDVVARIFAEQLVTFPRFLFSGELGRAWRRAA